MSGRLAVERMSEQQLWARLRWVFYTAIDMQWDGLLTKEREASLKEQYDDVSLELRTRVLQVRWDSVDTQSRSSR